MTLSNLILFLQSGDSPFQSPETQFEEFMGSLPAEFFLSILIPLVCMIALGGIFVVAVVLMILHFYRKAERRRAEEMRYISHLQDENERLKRRNEKLQGV